MITAHQLSLNFGQRALFDEIGFFIGKKDRIGLVGKNGAGKSSLLKIISGELDPSGGDLNIPKELTIGYLPQEMDHAEESTIMEEASKAFEMIQALEKRSDGITQELAEREDFQSESYHKLIEDLNEVNDRLDLLGTGQKEAKIERVLSGLGFESSDMERKLAEFSGGWKMRVELAKILLQNPDVLLLDEPTNHLDIESIEWLEDFLMNYTGAVVLISHDRTFLDRVTNRTIEISKGRIYDFKCSYTKYVVLREEQYQKELEAYRNQQKYIEDTQRLIEKFRAKKNKAAFAQTLIRKLEKLERIEPDDIEADSIHFRFPPAPRSGKIVMEAKNLSKSYGDQKIFEGVDLLLSRQDRIAIVGKNGIGKTTLTKILINKEAHGGELIPGHNIEIGHYAQDQAEQLNGDKTVFETVDEVAVGDIRSQIRNLLGAFLFRGDDVDKKVKVLSGGEKARLAMCKLLLHPVNLLVLDEPTNHLDMRSKDVLKEALQNYDGTLIIVSHDRDFLHGLVPVIQEVTPTGLREYRGDIYDFLKDKKAASLAEFERSSASPEREKNEARNKQHRMDYKERKALEKDKRKLQNRARKLESEIEKGEAKIKKMNLKLTELDYSNEEKSKSFLQSYEEEKADLEEKMELWSKAVEDLQEMEDRLDQSLR